MAKLMKIPHFAKTLLRPCFCRLISTSVTPESKETINLYGREYEKDHMTNITPSIISKMNKNLHLQKHHPLEITKSKIVEHFHASYRSRFGGCIYASIDNLNPIVTVEENFDSLLTPKDHVSRTKNDNYYVNSKYVLRSHTTAHEVDLIRSGWNAFLNTGDCYRRDEIDSSHYPIFHQLEGVRLFDHHELFGDVDDPAMKILEKSPTERVSEKQEYYTLDATRLVEYNLKYTLMQMVEYLFGEDTEMRWVDAYFPFTHPSWELEVKLNGEWMEMLGCGILEREIMKNAGTGDRIAFAFGLGLERFAMKLFQIPDIRLFWSEDRRFLSQFEENANAVFKPFSKYPPTYKDISFWLDDEDFSANDLFDIVRSIADDVVEEMNLVDKFTHPKTNRTSLCYRVTFRAMDRTLTDEEVNAIESEIRNTVVKTLKVTLR